MRADYALYVVALICFLIGAYAIVSVEEVQLYVYALAVVGIVFVGLGYMARPKATVVVAPTPTPPSTQPPEAPPKVEAAPEAEAEKEKQEPVKKTTRRTRRRRKKT
jgi:hypothetical protein